jgi:hypothetical protein
MSLDPFADRGLASRKASRRTARGAPRTAIAPRLTSADALPLAKAAVDDVVVLTWPAMWRNRTTPADQER